MTITSTPDRYSCTESTESGLASLRATQSSRCCTSSISKPGILVTLPWHLMPHCMADMHIEEHAPSRGPRVAQLFGQKCITLKSMLGPACCVGKSCPTMPLHPGCKELSQIKCSLALPCLQLICQMSSFVRTIALTVLQGRVEHVTGRIRQIAHR